LLRRLVACVGAPHIGIEVGSVVGQQSTTDPVSFPPQTEQGAAAPHRGNLRERSRCARAEFVQKHPGRLGGQNVRSVDPIANIGWFGYTSRPWRSSNRVRRCGEWPRVADTNLKSASHLHSNDAWVARRSREWARRKPSLESRSHLVVAGGRPRRVGPARTRREERRFRTCLFAALWD
jgi:hypothetical protein